MELNKFKQIATNLRDGFIQVELSFSKKPTPKKEPSKFGGLGRFITIVEVMMEQSNENTDLHSLIENQIENTRPKTIGRIIAKFLDNSLNGAMPDKKIAQIEKMIEQLRCYLDESTEANFLQELIKIYAPTKQVNQDALKHGLKKLETALTNYRMEVSNMTNTPVNPTKLVEPAITILGDDYIAESIMNTLPEGLFHQVDYDQVEEWFEPMTIMSGDITTLQFTINKWEYDEPHYLIINVVKHAGENGPSSAATMVTVYFDASEDKDCYGIDGITLPIEGLALQLQNVLCKNEVRFITDEQRAVINQLLA